MPVYLNICWNVAYCFGEFSLSKILYFVMASVSQILFDISYI